MGQDKEQTPLLLCTACGTEAVPGQHLCAKCNAPLTPFAHSDWVLGIQTRGFALQKATTAPQKLIVVIGMWLWLLPLLMFGLLIGFSGLMVLVECVSYGSTKQWPLGAIVLLLGTGITFVAGKILYRTTASYVRGCQTGAKESGDDENSALSTGESWECLSCGRTVAAEESKCPSCGWSFSE